MSNQPKTQNKFYQDYLESKAAFAAAGFKPAPADHPVYRHGGYMTRFIGPTENLSETSPTEENSPQKK